MSKIALAESFFKRKVRLNKEYKKFASISEMLQKASVEVVGFAVQTKFSEILDSLKKDSQNMAVHIVNAGCKYGEEGKKILSEFLIKLNQEEGPP